MTICSTETFCVSKNASTHIDFDKLVLGRTMRHTIDFDPKQQQQEQQKQQEQQEQQQPQLQPPPGR